MDEEEKFLRGDFNEDLGLMSNPDSEAPKAAAPDNVTESRNELDVSKLHALPSEQQELYLLSFTADLVQYTAKLDKD